MVLLAMVYKNRLCQSVPIYRLLFALDLAYQQFLGLIGMCNGKCGVN